jgi:ribosomal protein S18 acetylase RimI-like enzyme
MVIRRATAGDVDGICRVCAAGWRDTYRDLMTRETIERTIAEYYNPTRIEREIADPKGWDGWWVAEENGTVVGAGGGGMLRAGVGELFVLYLDPARRGAGIGSLLLDAITGELRERGAREQWVSVAKGNMKGIPFYRARGFVERGEQPAHSGSDGEDIIAIRMWRALGDSHDTTNSEDRQETRDKRR